MRERSAEANMNGPRILALSDTIPAITVQRLPMMFGGTERSCASTEEYPRPTMIVGRKTAKDASGTTRLACALITETVR